jgi:hypothetical protein
MKPVSLCLIILATFTFSLSKAMKTRLVHSDTSAQDSIYRIWKFKKMEMPQDFKGGMGIDKYDTWDLTKKNVLSYSVADSPTVVHSISYKLINNAIVLQLPDKQNNADEAQSKTGYIQFKTGDIQYKIKELTSTELKLIMHVKFNYEGKMHEADFVELDFEAKNK